MPQPESQQQSHANARLMMYGPQADAAAAAYPLLLLLLLPQPYRRRGIPPPIAMFAADGRPLSKLEIKRLKRAARPRPPQPAGTEEGAAPPTAEGGEGTINLAIKGVGLQTMRSRSLIGREGLHQPLYWQFSASGSGTV